MTPASSSQLGLSQPDRLPARTLGQGKFGKWAMGGVSILLCYHWLAVTAAPLAVPPASATTRVYYQAFAQYLQVLSLGHGYHFFAPNPGSSTLLRFDYTFANGDTKSETIPNRKIEPRLLYHRHFMLTEAYTTLSQLDTNLRQTYLRTLAVAACRDKGAESVTVTRITHNLPSMAWIRAGYSLDHPDTYQTQVLGTFRGDE